MSCGFLLGVAASIHIGLENEYNKLHPHARVQCDSYISGVYYNSEERASFYAGIEKELAKDLTIELGIVDGYTYETELVPFARVKYRNFFITPAYENGSENVGAVLGVEFLLGD